MRSAWPFAADPQPYGSSSRRKDAAVRELVPAGAAPASASLGPASHHPAGSGTAAARMSMPGAMGPIATHPTWRSRGAAAASTDQAMNLASPAPTSPKKATSLPLWRQAGMLSRTRRLWLSGALAAALLLCWLGYASQHSGGGRRPHSWSLMALHNEVEVHRRSVIEGPVFVEFTAPGLFLPLKDALELSVALHPAEQPLLDMLPSAAELAAVASLPPRPTIEQVLREKKEKEEAQAAEERAKASLATMGVMQGILRWQQGAGAGGGSAAGRAIAGEGSVGELVEGEAEQVQAQAQAGERRADRARVALEVHDSSDESSDEAVGRQLLGTGPMDESDAVRLLIGVTSACCTEKALRRRQAVRDTWAALAARQPGTAALVDVRFVLAQPDSPAALEKWLPILEEEVRMHNDTVVVRGADTYRNLPNKTIRLMRYAATHPAGYTHVLKTDDDCYLRLPQLLKALDMPTPPPAGATDATAAAAGEGGTGVAADQPAAAAAATAAAAKPAGGPGRRSSLAASAPKPKQSKKKLAQHSDGLSTYSLRDLTRKLGTWRWVDDNTGTAHTLGQLFNASRRSYAVVGSAVAGVLSQHAAEVAARAAARPRMAGVYLGCVENKNGFWPIRDSNSKWYISPSVLPDSAIPANVKYHAGWGYLLSTDLVEHAVKKVNLWQRHPDQAPAWFAPMDWEDVLMGLLVMDVVAEPEDHAGFRAAWRACPATTAVIHLDVDAPRLMDGLHAQHLSGLWDKKPVQCSSGAFLPGDYSGWKKWRDSLANVERL